LSPRRKETSERLDAHLSRSSLRSARRELGWFHGTLGGRVPEEGDLEPDLRRAAARIDGWLKSIPTFHRGALSLRHSTKRWPKPLTDEYRAWTSLVVRLECALHPSDVWRPTDELEEAGAKRLIEALASRRWSNDADDFQDRARAHVRDAIEAYAEARGEEPCVLPSKPASSGEQATQ
jgi:hypothetical protein